MNVGIQRRLHDDGADIYGVARINKQAFTSRVSLPQRELVEGSHAVCVNLILLPAFATRRAMVQSGTCPERRGKSTSTLERSSNQGRGLNTGTIAKLTRRRKPSKDRRKAFVSSASIVSSLGSLPFKMNGKVARYRSPRSSASRGGRIIPGRIRSVRVGGLNRNHRADVPGMRT